MTICMINGSFPLPMLYTLASKDIQNINHSSHLVYPRYLLTMPSQDDCHPRGPVERINTMPSFEMMMTPSSTSPGSSTQDHI